MSQSLEPYERLTWNVVIPEGYSHSRKIYISKEEVENTRWVAKIYPAFEQGLMAEEISYKISKLLNWNTIPKTKYLHQFADLSGKYKKYSILIQGLLEFPGGPIGLTFQKCINGCTAKKYLYTRESQNFEAPLNKKSYQKARLLNIILGRGDTKLENTMIGYSKGEFFEVDNELISSKYGFSFALSEFASFSSAKIDEDTLNEVLQIDISKFLAVKDKYHTQIKKFIASWNLHSNNKLKLNKANLEFENSFSQILKNIEVLKSSIRFLKNREEITSENIYREFSSLMKIKENEEEYRSRFVEGLEFLHKSHDFENICSWIQKGNCVVVYSELDKKIYERYVYYQGTEASAHKSRIIYVNVHPDKGLLQDGEWPAFLKNNGIVPVTLNEAQEIAENYNFEKSHFFSIGFEEANKDN